MPEIRNNSTATMSVAASALKAQQARMRVIAENMANATSTARTPGGDPYRRQIPVFTATQIEGGEGVRMSKIENDQRAFKTAYEPGHPGADAAGYVKLPNVDSLVEAMDMRNAQRAYEANLNVIETSRAMQMKTIELLKR
jgi:flagellar basal-body rod protein FlgC